MMKKAKALNRVLFFQPKKRKAGENDYFIKKFRDNI